jgi:Aspartyl protease/Domain of unknown function (DUF4124)
VRWWALRFVLLVLTGGLAGLLAAPASAQIYRWIDADGDIHYSQGVDSVPPRFRQSAVIIGYDRPATTPEPSGASIAGAEREGGRIKFTPGQPIIVAARINDRGSARLMLDTGAARTVISPAVLAALGVSYQNSQRGTLKGVTGDAEVVAVRVDSLEISGARYGPLMVVSHDTGFGPGRGDGLLGRDFLDHFTVTIDNSAGIVTLTPK